MAGDGRLRGLCLAGLWYCRCCARRSRAVFLAAASARRRGAEAALRRHRRMSRKRRRLLALAVGLGLLGAATALVLAAFNDNLVFFYGPSELAAKAIGPDRRIRIG